MMNLAKACEARKLPGVARQHRATAATMAAGILAEHLGDQRREADETAHPNRTAGETLTALRESMGSHVVRHATLPDLPPDASLGDMAAASLPSDAAAHPAAARIIIDTEDAQRIAECLRIIAQCRRWECKYRLVVARMTSYEAPVAAESARAMVDFHAARRRLQERRLRSLQREAIGNAIAAGTFTSIRYSVRITPPVECAGGG